MSQIEFVKYSGPRRQTDTGLYALDSTGDVRRLHKSLPAYHPTELRNLRSFAARRGLGAVLLKDESTRFGEQAFKPLGGVYAMYRVICRELGLDYRLTPPLELIQNPEYRKAIGQMTFITTTDGNHGRGVSWASGIFGAKSYVYMPRGTVEVRAENIRRAGNAHVEITDLLYDDCVKMTAHMAIANGWHLIQDTSWPGYEEIPTWIMLGYTTMIYEALSQMRALGYRRPTHVLLQAGVGSMAGAVCAAMKTTFGEDCPALISVEPTEVACIYESMKAADLRPHTSHGTNRTIMAGLNCATPCAIAWDYLRDYGTGAFRVSDDVTRLGMRRLAHPYEGDPTIVSGESGAVTFGLIDALTAAPEYDDIRRAIGLDKDAVVLLFSTEGDTDPENYRTIVKEEA